MEDEIPEDILRELKTLPNGVYEECLQDCLQETRFSVFKSSKFLVREVKDIEKLEEIQTLYSKFLVASAREWFISIPEIQNLDNPIIQQYLRLVLCELLTRNMIQETEGWCYITKQALLLWSLSPLCCKPLSTDLYLSGCTDCCYCRHEFPCMGSGGGGKCHKKVYVCFVEGGVHLCKTHAKRFFKPEPRLEGLVNERLVLDDGRVVWSLRNSDYMDVTGMEVDGGKKKEVTLNEFLGEYEWGGPPPSLKKKKEKEEWTDETLLKVRDYIVDAQPKESFWDDL